jgi:hypothetical protein
VTEYSRAGSTIRRVRRLPKALKDRFVLKKKKKKEKRKEKGLIIIWNSFFQWNKAPNTSLFEKRKKKKKHNHKMKRFFLNGIRPPKIDLFGKKKEQKKNPIIIFNSLKKIKETWSFLLRLF